MKVLIVALVACMLLGLALGIPAPQGGHGGGKDHMCNHKNDGMYPEPGSGCKKYYNCKQKKYHGPYQCKHSYKYDKEEEKCMPEEDAEC